jgi:hypothetical protein
MNIPLIGDIAKQDINTSLIAIRNAINKLNNSSNKSNADIQKQINLINKQIKEFNIKFGDIDIHLNAIDSDITDLQPVDTVASGNMKAVTSNAVFNLNSANITYNYSSEPRDVLSLIFNSANRRVSFMEIGGTNLTNDPLYRGSGDYYFYVFKSEGYISVTALDLYSNDIYHNSCQNGIWRRWDVITKTISISVTPTVTPVNLSHAIADMLNVLAIDSLPLGSYIYCCNYGTYFEANFTVTLHGAILVRGSTMGWDGVTAGRSDHLFTASKYVGEDWVIKIY